MGTKDEQNEFIRHEILTNKEYMLYKLGRTINCPLCRKILKSKYLCNIKLHRFNCDCTGEIKAFYLVKTESGANIYWFDMSGDDS